jgi:hypothetical protein
MLTDGHLPPKGTERIVEDCDRSLLAGAARRDQLPRPSTTGGLDRRRPAVDTEDSLPYDKLMSQSVTGRPGAPAVAVRRPR